MVMDATKRGFRLVHNKKGGRLEQSLVIVIFEIVIVIVAFFSLMGYVKLVKEDTLFEKSFLSNDIALVAETIYSAPGNIAYTYSQPKADISGFDFSFLKQKAGIVEDDGTDVVGFAYADDLFLYRNLNAQIDNPDKIEFLKSGNKIKAGESLTKNMDGVAIAGDELKKKYNLGDIKIVINPGYGALSYDYMRYGTDTSTADMIWNVAQSTEQYLKSLGFTKDIDFTRGQYEYRKPLTDIQNMIDPDANLVINIYAGNYENTGLDPVKVYFSLENANSQISSIMASHIMNNALSEVEGIEGFSIIPSDNALLSVNPDGVAVAVQIGNTKKAASILNTKSTDMAKGIAAGVKCCYSGRCG